MPVCPTSHGHRQQDKGRSASPQLRPFPFTFNIHPPVVTGHNHLQKKMKMLLSLFLLLYAPGMLSGQTILPTPERMETAAGAFRLRGKEVRCHTADTADTYVGLCRQYLFPDIALTFCNNPKQAHIRFIRDSTLAPEAYVLHVGRKSIEVRAANHNGFVYAIQTLRQCRIPDGNDRVAFRCVKIADRPRIAWRGFMLDSGRQYQSVGTIKKYIDMASLLKMNKFHWHLTEGLGWRVEIKRYPLLTEIGAYVATGKQQQGCYSREEIGDVVRYAAERGITVIPEIDMPGHAEAALRAYPALGCFGQPAKIPQSGFTEHIFCAGKDSTLQFLRNVLDEVCEMFPAPYIHLGGDEAPKGNWDRCPDCRKRIADYRLKDSHDLQLWLAAEMANHLKAKGKKAVFWGDVIYNDGYTLPDNAVIQWWNYRGRKELALKNALRHGYPVICSTNYYMYLNFPLTPWRGYGRERTFDARDVYDRNPSYEATRRPDSLIQGMECALWTDDGVTEQMIDQRLFPRILVLAEQMWHRGNLADFEAFYRNILRMKPWFEAQGYSFGPALKEEVPEGYRWE